MYLEKGVEEFGENHKPSPLTIACPYCGGWAMDVSGIQKVPGGGYVPMPEGYSYFANVGNKDCGEPTFPPKEEEGKTAKILIADEIDDRLREREMEMCMESMCGKRNRAEADHTNGWNEACVRALAKAGIDVDCMVEIIQKIAEAAVVAYEDIKKAMEQIASIIRADFSEKANIVAELEAAEKEAELVNLRKERNRKTEWEKRRAVEQTTAARFRQYKAKEIGWSARQRTRPRGREWRGAWKEN